MLQLKGLTPTGVRLTGDEPRLTWQVDGRTIETDFQRFRPIGLPNKTATDFQVTWMDFGDMAMDDPFYQFTRKKAKDLPFAADQFKTDRQTAQAIANIPKLLPFNGVVFHMARTGSTLIHRLFSCTGKVQSLSEVGPIDRILSLTENWAAAERDEAIRTVVATYRRARRPAERHFITKMTDSGASIRLPLFRSAFPSVPWIFVYRDPLEVMASVLRRPTGTLDGWYKNRVMAAERLDMPALRDPGMWPAEFIARTLRRFCATAVEAAHATPKGLFLAVPYKRLPDAIWETIAPHFGIELTSADIDAMRAEARFSAKKTDATEFRPDSERKQEEATPRMRMLAARFCAPVIEELQRLPQA